MTAKTTAQRQAEWKQRRLAEGLKEVRGIWLPPEHHEKVRRYADRLKRTKS